MPTGVLATLGRYIPLQNARMLQMLLAKHGGLFILPDDFEKLPLYFQLGCIPIMSGMPPFGYWEKREEGSRIPPHRTDAGVFLSAEVLGAQARDLHQGRGRPLHRRSEEEPGGDAHPAHHARSELLDARSARPRPRARRHRVPAARALLQGAADRQRPQAGPGARRARRARMSARSSRRKLLALAVLAARVRQAAPPKPEADPAKVTALAQAMVDERAGARRARATARPPTSTAARR